MLPALGRLAGSAFGMSGVGQAVGTGLSRLFGKGDYSVSSNSLMMGGVPSFETLDAPFRFKHKELVNIPSTLTNFGVPFSLPINPGMLAPILSQFATSFTMYKFHGLVFIYNPTSGTGVTGTNTAMGVVGMVANYDPSAPTFSTRQAAEQYAGCQSASPSTKLLLPIECKPSSTMLERRYIRAGDATASKTLQETDLGLFQYFADGAQASSVAGELWVAYDVEFYLPKIAQSGNSALPDLYVSNSTGSFANNATARYSRFTKKGLSGLDFQQPGCYMVSCSLFHPNQQVSSLNISTYGNCSQVSISPFGTSKIDFPYNAETSSDRYAMAYINVNTTSASNPAGFDYNVALTSGVPNNVWVYVHRITTNVLNSYPSVLSAQRDEQVVEIHEEIADLREKLQSYHALLSKLSPKLLGNLLAEEQDEFGAPPAKIMRKDIEDPGKPGFKDAGIESLDQLE